MASVWAWTTSACPTAIRACRWTPRMRASALDHNRCMLCARCVRVCDEIEGAHTWDIMGRGIDCRVITDMNQPWGASTPAPLRQMRARLPHRRPGRKREGGGGDEKRGQFLPYLTAMRGSPHMSNQVDWPRFGWMAAPAATCRSSTWTSACSTSPTKSTWSTARWWMSRVPGECGPHHHRGRGQQRGGPAQGPHFRRTKMLWLAGRLRGHQQRAGHAQFFTCDEIWTGPTSRMPQNNQMPVQVVPPLLPRSRRCTRYVKVDVFVPGCPPNADAIFYAVQRAAGRAHAGPGQDGSQVWIKENAAMAKTIVIDPVTRIEGHSKITVLAGRSGPGHGRRISMSPSSAASRNCEGRPFRKCPPSPRASAASARSAI
jgi:hypothetical protein